MFTYARKPPSSVETPSSRPPSPATLQRAPVGGVWESLSTARSTDAGRPPPAAMRAQVEGATGVDLAGARVHDDAAAAQAARAEGALAFTRGSDIFVDRAAQERHGPSADRLLAHELVHVAQQRGDGPLLGGDAAEREADTRADAAISGGAPAARGPVGRVPHGTVQRKPAPYDKTRFTLTPLPKDITLADVQRELGTKKAASDIKSWSTVGVKAGSTEELYVLYAVWQVSKADRWGTEVDLVTEVGPGTKGAITVRIDEDGNAVGELIASAAPTVAAAYPDVATAIADLTKKYKLAAIKGENGKRWSLDDLNKVAAAWALLTPGEAAALEGFELIRTTALRTDSGDPLSGLTTHGDGVAPDGRSVIKTRQIRIADSAFAADDKAFVGDGGNALPASAMTLVHEAGHAVEQKVVEDATAGENEAVVAMNRAAGASTAALRRAAGSLNSASKAWGKFKEADQTASKPYLDALGAAFEAIKAFHSAVDPTTMATLEAPAKAAITARDAAKKAVPDKNPAHSAFATAARDLDASLTAASDLLSRRKDRAAAQAKVASTREKTGNHSKRLQKFVDFVTGQVSPITEYAKRNWPAHPEEFYAEAFTLWHTDPRFLASHSPALKAWFDRGEHLRETTAVTSARIDAVLAAVNRCDPSMTTWKEEPLRTALETTNRLEETDRVFLRDHEASGAFWATLEKKLAPGNILGAFVDYIHFKNGVPRSMPKTNP